MKRTSRETLDKAVEILVKKLHFKPEDIMVTGSLALELHGILPDNRNPHDCDFHIVCDDQTWRCMKLVAAVYGEKDDFYPGGNGMLAFKAGDIKFNVWRKKTFIHPDLKDRTGVWVSPAKDVLKEKREMGRSKDIQDLNDICRLVLG